MGAVVAVAVGGSVLSERFDLRAARSEEKEDVLGEVSAISFQLESIAISTFHLISGLGSYIEVHPDLPQAAFETIARRLQAARPGMLNVAAAPDMVVRYVYPLEGNEAVLGLDYRQNEAQRAAAEQVRESRMPVIAGPVNLLQGGRAVIGRFPVFVRDEAGKDRFWGIISTPIEMDYLYRESGLWAASDRFEFALRGKDAKGASGEVFYGEASLFDEDPLLFDVHLINGSWQFAARPTGGWLALAPHRWWIRSGWLIFALLVGAVLWLTRLYVIRVEHQRAVEARAQLIKSRFLANMGHEIRTPLHGIQGLAQLLHTNLDSAEDRTLATTIIKSAQSLTTLLNDVLQLSEMEAEGSPVQAREVDLDLFFEELLVPIQIEVERKGLSFKRHFQPARLGRVRSDPAVLRQIVWNLLTNAVKFTEKGSVTLSVRLGERAANGRAEIFVRVSDTGIGIATDRLDSIFDLFEQEDGGYARRFGGMGVGLPIVKRCVRRLGGNVTVHSAKGSGSSFEAVVMVERPA